MYKLLQSCAPIGQNIIETHPPPIILTSPPAPDPCHKGCPRAAPARRVQGRPAPDRHHRGRPKLHQLAASGYPLPQSLEIYKTRHPQLAALQLLKLRLPLRHLHPFAVTEDAPELHQLAVSKKDLHLLAVTEALQLAALRSSSTAPQAPAPTLLYRPYSTAHQALDCVLPPWTPESCTSSPCPRESCTSSPCPRTPPSALQPLLYSSSCTPVSALALVIQWRPILDELPPPW